MSGSVELGTAPAPLVPADEASAAADACFAGAVAVDEDEDDATVVGATLMVAANCCTGTAGLCPLGILKASAIDLGRDGCPVCATLTILDITVPLALVLVL